MSDIEQKAIALVNEVRMERGQDDLTPINRQIYLRDEALCRAIERHEATKQEYSDFQQLVSDRVKIITSTTVDDGVWRTWASDWLSEFIIPAAKPDPLVEIIEQCSRAKAEKGETWEEAMARNLRAALDARGITIVEVKNDD